MDCRPALEGVLGGKKKQLALLNLEDDQEVVFLRKILSLQREQLVSLAKVAADVLERLRSMKAGVEGRVHRKRVTRRLRALGVVLEAVPATPASVVEPGMDEELEQRMEELPQCMLNPPTDQLVPCTGKVVTGNPQGASLRPGLPACSPGDTGSPIASLAPALQLEDMGAAGAMLTMRPGVTSVSSEELRGVLAHLDLELMDTATRWTHHGLCVVVRRSPHFCALARGAPMPQQSGKCSARLIPRAVRWVSLARVKRTRAVGFVCVPPSAAGAAPALHFATACVNAQLLRLGVEGRVICDRFGEGTTEDTNGGTVKGLVAGLSPVTLSGSEQDMVALRQGVSSLMGSTESPPRAFAVPSGTGALVMNSVANNRIKWRL